MNDRDAARQLRQPLFELLTIVIGRGRLNLLSKFLATRFDSFLRSSSADDRRVFAVTHYTLGLTQLVDGDIF